MSDACGDGDVSNRTWTFHSNGGPGRDRLLGGRGRDICLGGPGRDRVRCP
jgi:hypothetical protein